MFGQNVGTGLTFGKVLSGISKTLNVANQVIPLYREAKPMITNAKTILSALKEFNTSSNTKTNTNNTSINQLQNKKETSVERRITASNPRFFL